MDEKELKLKDKVLGNYLVQTGNEFPLDCETFDYIQNNNFITEILGNIAGDQCFIYGCQKTGTEYQSGYVFLRTDEHPEGEILPFEKGNTETGKAYIKSETVRVTANGKEYETAYTKRWLSLTPPAVYDKTVYNLNYFTYASYNRPLYGEIKIWSGPGFLIPGGYLPCDGRELEIAKYPNLYNVIGTIYNKQHIGSRTTYKQEDYYQTRDGYFRIPDLTARFVMGCDGNEFINGDDVNPDGYEFGSQGGLSTCKLTHKQSGLPSHDHPPGDFYTGGSGNHRHWFAADSNAWRLTGMYDLVNYTFVSNNCSAEGTGAGGVMQTSWVGDHSHKVVVHAVHCDSENAKESHENKPPFMVLYYIIRCY